MKILIVDDDLGTLNALKVYLISVGHQVVIARDGEQALHTVKSSINKMKSVEILVTDLKMKGMNGLELIQALSEEDPWIRIIAISGKAAHRLPKAEALGAMAVLEKPVDPEKLWATIEEALDKLEQSAKYEVVILDVKMPGIDGIETLKRIKKSHPLVEVIMLTGHATVESAIEGMKLGAFDYLMKPCDIDDLVSKVDEATARKQLHEEKIAQARIKEITLRRD